MVKTNQTAVSFNNAIPASTHREQQRLKNVVGSQSVAESFIGELRFKTVDSNPDGILCALVPMKQAGTISADEILAIRNILVKLSIA